MHIVTRDHYPRTHSPRFGRRSAPNQIYHVITATHHREEVFSSFRLGREVVLKLREARENELANTIAFVVMPDHMHWLMQLGHKQTLSECVRWVKARSAYAVNRKRDSTRAVWQSGFFDAAVRHEHSLLALSRYIVANPLRAGLVDSIGDYPLWDAVWMAKFSAADRGLTTAPTTPR
ncbi:MAG: transposase [Woeseiaceae bacterium]|nr:transposase [Woeseiaceae bacterium]